MKQCINLWWQRRSIQQRQWLWFVALWCGGLFTVLALSKLIKWGMGV